MTKKAKTLIGVGIAVLVLVAALIVVMKFLPSTTDETSSSGKDINVLWDTGDDELESIHIQYEDQDYTIEKLTSSKYGIAEIEDYVSDTTAFSTILSSCSRVSTYNIITDVTNLAPYGLDDPYGMITFVFENSTHVLTIGDLNPSGKSYYVLCDDDDSTVYVLQTQTTDYYLVKETSYIDLTIEEGYDTTDNSDAPTYSYYELTRPDLEKDIYIRALKSSEKKSSTNYGPTIKMVSPIESLVLDEAIGTYMYGIFGLEGQECVEIHLSEDNMAEYGLDNPVATLHTKFDNSEVTFTVGGWADEDQTMYYFTTSRRPELVYTVLASDITWVTVTADQMVSPVAVMPYIQDISRITLRMNQGEDYVFDLTHTTGDDDKVTTTVTCNGQEVDADMFKRYLQLIMYTSGEEIYTGDPVSDDNEALYIQYDYFDYDSDVVKILKNTARYGVMEVNGAQNFTARLAYIDKLETELQHLFDGEYVDTEW